MTNTGTIVRRLRLRLKLSQAELSRRSGVNSITISQIENGRTTAWPGYQRKLARALGVSVEELRGG